MKHPITPLILVHADGFIEYTCLQCGRPVSKSPSMVYWRHYQRQMWRPGAGKAA